MGINSSFLTQSCAQLHLQLTQKNLLSLDFQKISSNDPLNQNSQIQFYQHCYTKKLYKLEKFQCNRKDSHLLSKALKNLQSLKNNHICNLIFSQVNTKLTNIISKHSEVKIFSEHSSFNLLNFINQKVKSIKIDEQITQTLNILFTDIQIANFIHGLSGIASQISSLYLPLKCIDPQNIIMMENQHGKIKYSIKFDQILNQNSHQNHKGYSAPQLLGKKQQKQFVFGLNQNSWSQKYEKNLIYGLGMVILQFLLMESCDDCYHYKSGEFCQSELQKKLFQISSLLQKRLIDRQESVQYFKQSRASFSSLSGRLSTKSNYLSDQEPFQVILYELIMEMLCQDPQKRITIKQLKFRSRKLMSKVHQEVMLKSKSQNSNLITSVFEKAKKQKAMISSPDLPVKEESFILTRKISLNNETNNTDSVMPESRTKSVIKHLKSNRFCDKEKSFIMDLNSSFLTNKENYQMQNSQLPNEDGKKGFRKLSGYQKVKISEHSFIEGFFQDDKAHGLGKITRKNGEIIECIFHNNEIIDGISAKQ